MLCWVSTFWAAIVDEIDENRDEVAMLIWRSKDGDEIGGVFRFYFEDGGHIGTESRT